MESLERWQQTPGLGNPFILAQLCEGAHEHKLCHCVGFAKTHVGKSSVTALKESFYDLSKLGPSREAAVTVSLPFLHLWSLQEFNHFSTTTGSQLEVMFGGDIQ